MSANEALRLAALGLAVFTVSPSGFPWKLCDHCDRNHRGAGVQTYEACGCLHCHSFYRSSTDPEVITGSWESRPAGLLAVATGLRSGVVVLDFDCHEGGADGMAVLARLKKAGLLPQTVTTRSGGGGIHLYYRYPDGVAVPSTILEPGVDVQSDGKLVLAPPAQKTGKKAYSWYPGRAPWEQSIADMHPEILDRILVRPSRVGVTAGVAGTGAGVDVGFAFYPATMASFGKALRKLESAGRGDGRSNNRLYGVGRQAGELVAAGRATYQEVYSAAEAVADALGLITERDFPKTFLSGFWTAHNDWEPTSVSINDVDGTEGVSFNFNI